MWRNIARRLAGLRLTAKAPRFATLRRGLVGLVIVGGLLSIGGTLTLPVGAGGMTYEVNQVENAISQGDGTCDGTCTLRDAILAANAHPGHDTIVFASEVFAPDSGNSNIITPSPLPRGEQHSQRQLYWVECGWRRSPAQHVWNPRR